MPHTAQAQNCPAVTGTDEHVCTLESGSGFAADLFIGYSSTFPGQQAADSFTTGDTEGVYLLRSVHIHLAGPIGTPGDISVAIHAQASGGPADDPVENGVLSGANPTAEGVHEFTASGVVLDGGITYFIVLSAPEAPPDGTHGYDVRVQKRDRVGSSGWSVSSGYRVKEARDAAFVQDVAGRNLFFAVIATPIGGITASETALAIDEAGTGNEDEYTLALNTAPTANVVITPSIAPAGFATFTPSSLTFTAANWDTPSTITVTAIDDSIDNEGDARTATITHAVTSDDPAYAALSGNVPTSVEVTVADDDAPASIPALRLKLRVFLESALP